MNSTHTSTARQGAISIAEGLEREIREGRLTPGQRLPSIRSHAEDIGVSPATVAAAYQRLRTRGLIVASRRGTVVAPQPDLLVRGTSSVPEGILDVSHGNPNPSLLPDLGSISAGETPLLYGSDQNVVGLVDLARTTFRSDGVPADHVAVVGSSHDGIERAIAAHLLPGDAIAVEDPGFSGTYDLVRAMGMELVPVPIDEHGMTVEGLAAALDRGASGVVITSRAQNPTGAALTAERASQLGNLLDANAGVLMMEDDHAGPVAGAPFVTTVRPHHERWIVVRSFGKYLAPDLRVALMAGDELTISRVQAKQLVGVGWVSQLLQHLALRGLTDPAAVAVLDDARDTYAVRRSGLRSELDERGVPSWGESGFNVWVPVESEAEAYGALLQEGWLVAAGARDRLETPPGIRITVSSIDDDQIPALAEAVASAVQVRRRA